tara:strand:- start:1597 stop:2895 length:1299 start_codon:yes stop_codon:yes gene_type:complete
MSIFDVISDIFQSPDNREQNNLFRKLRESIDLQDPIYHEINGSIDKNVKETYENFWYEFDMLRAHQVHRYMMKKYKMNASGIESHHQEKVSQIKNHKIKKERWIKALRNECIALVYYFETNDFTVLKDAFKELDDAMIDYYYDKRSIWKQRLDFLTGYCSQKDYEWMFKQFLIIKYRYFIKFMEPVYDEYADAIFDSIHDDYYYGRSSYELFMSYWSEITKVEFNTQLPVLSSASAALKNDITIALQKIYHSHLYRLAVTAAQRYTVYTIHYAHREEEEEKEDIDNWSIIASAIIADPSDTDIKIPKITKRYIHKDLHKRKSVNSIPAKELTIEKFSPDLELMDEFREYGPGKEAQEKFDHDRDKFGLNATIPKYYLPHPRIYSDTSISGYFDPKQIPATLLPNELSQVCSYCKYENTLNAAFCSGCGKPTK